MTGKHKNEPKHRCTNNSMQYVRCWLQSKQESLLQSWRVPRLQFSIFTRAEPEMNGAKRPADCKRVQALRNHAVSNVPCFVISIIIALSHSSICDCRASNDARPLRIWTGAIKSYPYSKNRTQPQRMVMYQLVLSTHTHTRDFSFSVYNLPQASILNERLSFFARNMNQRAA